MVHLMKNSMNNLIKIGSVLLLSGCSLVSIPEQQSVTPQPIVKIEKEYVYITPKVVIPARPILPMFRGSDIACLSDEMKLKISNRDRLRRDYAEDLESILKSLNSIGNK